MEAINSVFFVLTENQYQLVTWSRDNTLRLCKYETSGSAKVSGLLVD